MYELKGNTLLAVLKQLSDIIAEDKHWEFDEGHSSYKSICRFGYAIMRESALWGSKDSDVHVGSADYIREKLRSIESYLPK
jgi:hypothetical protein